MTTFIILVRDTLDETKNRTYNDVPLRTGQNLYSAMTDFQNSGAQNFSFTTDEDGDGNVVIKSINGISYTATNGWTVSGETVDSQVLTDIKPAAHKPITFKYAKN